MARTKIELPQNFSFNTIIPIRITDVNYGGHVGNDSVLSLIHEARVQYLRSFGYAELNLEGVGLIMSDVMIEFKGELFYGESIVAYVVAAEFSKVSFEIYYKFVKKKGVEELRSERGKEEMVVVAKTTMVCFNYEKRKIVSVPENVIRKLSP